MSTALTVTSEGARPGGFALPSYTITGDTTFLVLALRELSSLHLSF
jgi:hypothetical protein